MPYSATELESLLRRLLQNWENEVVEFKQGGDGYSTDKIGKYFSALSNEANLREESFAWLIFGVNNKTRAIEDSDYRPEPERLQGLKHQIADDTEPSVTFREIYELQTQNGRVVLFQIPAAPRGLPISWKGYPYAREGESLGALSLDKQDEIRDQSRSADWSAQIVEEASTSDLDPTALSYARERFAEKHRNRFSPQEVEQWSHETFLDRAKVTIGGQQTRASLLLLGKPESSHHLLPYPAQMTWKLEGRERGYEHFGPPFLLKTTELYQRIRNIKVQVLPDNELLRREVSKYDQKIILEALHNCIAHQDYLKRSRIVVQEREDCLVFENAGGFFDGLPSDYALGDRTAKSYRNVWLAQAMAELGMIDTMGYGIHDMFEGQRRRFFPLPNYDLSDPEQVKVTIFGQIIDVAYSRLLIQKTDLSLPVIMGLDRVQKGLPIDGELLKLLRKEKLVEGRKNRLHVAATVAEATASKADYTKMRSFDDAHYERLIREYLEKFGSASRKEINDLLLDKLSDAMDEQQKLNKIHNLLTKLRKSSVIENIGSRGQSSWVLLRHEF